MKPGEWKALYEIYKPYKSHCSSLNILFKLVLWDLTSSLRDYFVLSYPTATATTTNINIIFIRIFVILPPHHHDQHHHRTSLLCYPVDGVENKLTVSSTKQYDRDP